jgi:hypothetical protein
MIKLIRNENSLNKIDVSLHVSILPVTSDASHVQLPEFVMRVVQTVPDPRTGSTVKTIFKNQQFPKPTS